jgi:hypothetical protein
MHEAKTVLTFCALTGLTITISIVALLAASLSVRTVCVRYVFAVDAHDAYEQVVVQVTRSRSVPAAAYADLTALQLVSSVAPVSTFSVEAQQIVRKRRGSQEA